MDAVANNFIERLQICSVLEQKDPAFWAARSSFYMNAFCKKRLWDGERGGSEKII